MRNPKIANTRRLQIKTYIAAILLSVFWLIGLSSFVDAQDKHSQQNLHTGIPYSISDVENINLTNGNLMFNFDFGTVRGRGSAASGFGLKYNSKLYETHVMTTLDLQGDMSPQKFLRGSYESGWQYDGGYDLRVINRNDEQDQPLQISDSCGKPVFKAVYVWKVIMYFPDGSQHEFQPTGYSDVMGDFQSDGYFNVNTRGEIHNLIEGCVIGSCPNCETNLVISQDPNPKMTYYSIDGTYMRLEIPNGQGVRNPSRWTIYMPDGSKIENGELDGQGNPLPQRIYDKNGNYVQRNDWGDNGWVDEFGRKVERVSVSQMEDHIIRSGVGGEDLIWKVRWKYITVIKKYTTSTANDWLGRCCYSHQVLVHRPKVVDEIELPQQMGGQKFIFNYNGHEGFVEWNLSVENPNSSPGWGDLVSVTLPSGAEAQYEYGTTVPFLAFDVNDLMPLLGKTKEKRLIHTSDYDGTTQQVTDTWAYSINQSGSTTVTQPDGGVSTQHFYRADIASNFSGRVYKEVSSNGTITERIWGDNRIPCPDYGCTSPMPVNTYVKTEFTTIPDAAGNPSLTAIKDFNYDKNGNLTRIAEYDWVPYSTLPRDSLGIVTGIPGGAVISRITENSFYNQTEDASNSTWNNPASYWNTTAPNVRNAVKSSEIKSGSGTPFSRTEIEYDNPATTANPIVTKVWDSFKGGTNQPYSNPLSGSNSISTTAQYDQYGNPVLTADAKGVQTQFTHGDIVGPNGTVNGLYPTQTVAAYGTPLARTSTAVYDFYTGLTTSATDVDNGVTSATEYDALGRPLKSIAAKDTLLEVWTQTEYDDINRRVIVRSDLETKGDGKKVAIQHYDQLGRVRLSRSIENIATEDPYNETHGIKVQTRYQIGNPNSYQLTSNPFRAATSTAAINEPTMGWTRSMSVNTGRHAETETFSGAALPAPWGTNTSSTGKVLTDIDADRTLVTDQAGKQRISRTNALGQLKDVWEVTAADSATEAITFPNQTLSAGYRTSYTYDTLNNLITVNQGVQTRSFSYNSLSRLMSATNPESGTINYLYDNNGNLTQKTDARGVQTDYVYDDLNRVTNRNYSTPGGTPPNYQATPNVTYTYDDPLIANSKGRLTKVTNGSGLDRSTTEYTSFDILGRMTGHKQTTDGTGYTTGYLYNLSGALIEETYPSGRVVKNVLDNEGDLTQVQSKKNASDIFRPYVSNFVYTAAGAASSLKLGNNKFENTQFNSRLQPIQIGLGSSASTQNLLKLNFDYGTIDNNGNVKSQTITVPTVSAIPGFVATQNYTYDSLNRIKQATETIPSQTGWQQTFVYDRYGNRRFDTTTNATTTLDSNCVTAVCNPEINTANNRLVGYVFDTSGNTTTDANGQTFIYDAENKQVQVNDSNGIVGQYFYDGDGRRIKKIVPNTDEITVFVYDAAGKLIQEHSTIVASPSEAKTSYLTNDHLGSPRIITDQFGQVISKRDFMPFGEEIARPNYGNDSVRQKFTGYERDTETELDFAQSRYFVSGFGRFSTADDFSNDTDSVDPQSWNLFTYVRNNPLNATDPLGKEIWVNFEGKKWKYVREGDKGSFVDSDGNAYTGTDNAALNLFNQLAESHGSQINGLIANGYHQFDIGVSQNGDVSGATNWATGDLSNTTTGLNINVSNEERSKESLVALAKEISSADWLQSRSKADAPYALGMDGSQQWDKSVGTPASGLTEYEQKRREFESDFRHRNGIRPDLAPFPERETFNGIPQPYPWAPPQTSGLTTGTPSGPPPPVSTTPPPPLPGRNPSDRRPPSRQATQRP